MTVIIGSVFSIFNTWMMKILKYYKNKKYFLKSLSNTIYM